MAKNSTHHLTDNIATPLIIARQYAVSNAAGSGAGASVSTAVTFTDRFGNGLLTSANYVVLVTPSQACLAPTVINKSPSGFTVVLTPPSGVTLSSGTFDCVVVAS